MRVFLVIYVFVLVLIVSILGFRGQESTRTPLRVFPDMDEQMKHKPQAASSFFADGMQERPVVPGTVQTTPPNLEPHAPYNTFIEDDYKRTGRVSAEADAEFGRGFPAGIEVSREVLGAGQEKYTIFCSRCHGYVGDGKGITSKYGMLAVPSFHDARLLDMPEGEIFNTITHGKGLMGAYGSKLQPHERWAVIMYVRALQRARTATMDDVPPAERAALETQ